MSRVDARISFPLGDVYLLGFAGASEFPTPNLDL
jgi:hypothetical protein